MSQTLAPMTPAAPGAGPRVAAVVIGRNEGARLAACLASLKGQVGRVVYVDSGSQDGSLDLARANGAEGIALDHDTPFSAARARNAGVSALRAQGIPQYVLFIDGDCSLHPDWLAQAVDFLEARPEAAVACGRRRERYPRASVYNWLCDWEWDTPVGQADACGGDSLMRLAAFEGVGGFRPALIAGEEPELCHRLLSDGWQVWRLDHDMTLHDADMHRFGQWWRRGIRAGHAFAELGALHDGLFARERRRIWFWAAALPGAVAALAAMGAGAVAAPLAGGLYALSWARVSARFRRWGMTPGIAIRAGGLLTLSKFCNLQGMLGYHLRRWRGRRARIIEYK